MRQLQASKLAGRCEVVWNDAINDIEPSDEFTMLVAHEFFDALPINIIAVPLTIAAVVCAHPSRRKDPRAGTKSRSTQRQRKRRIRGFAGFSPPHQLPCLISLPVHPRVSINSPTERFLKSHNRHLGPRARLESFSPRKAVHS